MNIPATLTIFRAELTRQQEMDAAASWRWHEHKRANDADAPASIADEESRAVAMCPRYGLMPGGGWEANSALIVSLRNGNTGRLKAIDKLLTNVEAALANQEYLVSDLGIAGDLLSMKGIN